MAEFNGQLANASKLSKQEKKRIREEALSKIDSFTTLVTSVEAGAFHECASTIGSAATTDWKKGDYDERFAKGKRMAEDLRIMANWFKILHYDVMAGNYTDKNPTKEAALNHLDQTRLELFRKFWHFYDEITTRLHPSTLYGPLRPFKAL